VEEIFKFLNCGVGYINGAVAREVLIIILGDLFSLFIVAFV
jgi:hypothetical protein